MNTLFDLAIIGGGPAGMMTAIQSAKNPNLSIVLLEKNPVLGQKLLLTGKGRCNVTNTKNIREIVDAFGPRGKFLYSALTSFSNQNLISWLNQRGVPTVVERGQRVFPQSGQADSILQCLVRELQKPNIQLLFNASVAGVEKKPKWFVLNVQKNKKILARRLVVATGGLSYPATGSTGDGYRFAQKMGHKILPLKPALTALISNQNDIRSLSGLTLKNITLSYYSDSQKLLSIFGEMVFTHSGLSGPIVLTTSKQVYEWLEKGKKITAAIDFKPALDHKTLQQRLIREIHHHPKKEYQTLLKTLLPKSLIPVFINRTAIDRHKKNGHLTKEEVNQILQLLKKFTFTINRTALIQTAIVTAGGINPKEINQRTMESTLVNGLYFTGEIIALDGPTGGYNLQKAFSTGYLAGTATARQQA